MRSPTVLAIIYYNLSLSRYLPYQGDEMQLSNMMINYLNNIHSLFYYYLNIIPNKKTIKKEHWTKHCLPDITELLSSSFSASTIGALIGSVLDSVNNSLSSPRTTLLSVVRLCQIPI